MVALSLRVQRRALVADGVVALTLADPAYPCLPAWQPGAHIDVQLAPGLVRQYSLCGDPNDQAAWQIAVQRERSGRGGSAHVHDLLHQDSPVTVTGLRNNFAFEPAARYLFIAGGIGITPLLPMMAEANRRGSRWQLHYGGRARTTMAFADELSNRYGDRVVLTPADEQGALDLDRLLARPEPGTLIYCCGPEALLTAVEQRCAAWPQGTLHVERFRPRLSGAGAPNAAFEVELSRSGRRIAVPADQTVLEAVRAAGVAVPSSCEEGTCGTCETPVLAGEPEHRDSLLTERERAANDTMMLCVSRCRGSLLVLDL